MGKPFNAGVAASNGVEAAQLAKRGFVSCDDGVGGPQGFIDAHVDEACEEAAWASPSPATFLFEDVKHKLHACCHGLHATIEALRQAQRMNALDPSAVTGVRHPRQPALAQGLRHQAAAHRARGEVQLRHGDGDDAPRRRHRFRRRLPDGDASGLKNAAAGANLGLTSPPSGDKRIRKK